MIGEVGYMLRYDVYYVIKIEHNTTTNPIEDMENAQSLLVEAVIQNPSLGSRALIENCTFSATQDNDMNSWARDLNQPYIASLLTLVITGAE